MSITFRQLQVFVAAAGDGNFRKTADRLGISQPAVSAQIRAIELELGHPLFERRRGAASMLSPEGQEFLSRARELVEVQRGLAAERNARRVAQPLALRVSVGPILLESRVKPMLPELYDTCPEVELDFVPFNPASDAARLLREAAVDVLLYTGAHPAREHGNTEIIATVGCSIYGAPHLARALSRADLSDAPFVMPPTEHQLYRLFEAQLARAGIFPRNLVARPPYMDVALQMVVAGKGLAVLFDEHASMHVGRREVQAIRGYSFRACRVMMMGKRAMRPEFAPVLRFLRDVAGPCASAAEPSHPAHNHSRTDVGGEQAIATRAGS
jgi:DNA-binding transcriptional LysR family regulator